jgi:hypothetical protein
MRTAVGTAHLCAGGVVFLVVVVRARGYWRGARVPRRARRRHQVHLPRRANTTQLQAEPFAWWEGQVHGRDAALCCPIQQGALVVHKHSVYCSAVARGARRAATDGDPRRRLDSDLDLAIQVVEIIHLAPAGSSTPQSQATGAGCRWLWCSKLCAGVAAGRFASFHHSLKSTSSY